MFKNYLQIIIFLLFIPYLTFADVEIVKVMCNPIGSDSDGEWVQIKNTGSSDIDLTGWKFNDGSNHILNAPPKNGGKGSLLISPGDEAYLANKADKVNLTGTVIDTVMSLNNKQDTISLVEGNGTVHTSISYDATGLSEGELCYGGTASSGSDTDNSSSETKSIQFKTVTIEPPADVHLRITVPEVSFVGSGVAGVAELYSATGKVVSSRDIFWNFGDGVTFQGKEFNHIYKIPGTYTISAYVKYDNLFDSQEKNIEIKPLKIRVFVPKNAEYVEVFNDADSALNIGGWRLSSGSSYFIFPKNTKIPAKNSVPFHKDILKLPMLAMNKRVELFNLFAKKVADSNDFTVLLTEGEIENSTTSTSTISLIEASTTIAQITNKKQNQTKINNNKYIKNQHKKTSYTPYGHKFTNKYHKKVQPKHKIKKISDNKKQAGVVLGNKEELASVASIFNSNTIKEWGGILFVLAIIASIVLYYLPMLEYENLNQKLKKNDNQADKFTIKEIK